MNKKNSPSLWCIYHIPSSRGYEGLLFDEVRAIATVNVPDEWLIWREGWTDWRQMNEHEGFEEPLIRPLNIERPPAIPETMIGQRPQTKTRITKISRNSQAQYNDDVDDDIEPSDDPDSKSGFVTSLVDSISFIGKADTQGNQDKRKAKRFDKRYEVTISVNGQAFQTRSLDVSIGGLMLEDPIPDWATGHFKVRVRKGKSQIELMAYRLLDEANRPMPDRIGFLPLKNQQDESNLESWLKAG